MATATAKAVQRLHFNLPPLPYPEDALEPVISAETLGLHHGKHHKKYVDTMNELLASADVRGSSLEDIVRSSQGKLFNNAAQAWNHDFYWHSLTPKAGAPSAAMRRRLERDFGTYESFLDKFAAAANGQFGSGWAWLVESGGKLAIESTPNQDNPMMDGKKAIMGIDVWEHAYYLKYQNRRPEYITAWWNVVNWDAVASRYRG